MSSHNNTAVHEKRLGSTWWTGSIYESQCNHCFHCLFGFELKQEKDSTIFWDNLPTFLTRITHQICLTSLVPSSLWSIFAFLIQHGRPSHTVSSLRTVMWQSVQSLPSRSVSVSLSNGPHPPLPPPKGVTPTDRTNFLLIGPQEIAPRFNLLLDSHEDMWSAAAFSPSHPPFLPHSGCRC